MKQIANNIKKAIQYIFIPAFIGYLLCGFFTATSIFSISSIFGVIAKIVRYIAYVVFILNIIIEYKKITVLDLLLLFLSLTVTYFSKDIYITAFALILLSLKTKNINEIFKKVYYIYLFSFITIVTLSIFKIIPDWTFNRGDIVRHSLGFIYPTDCYSIFLSIVLLKVFVSKSNIKFYEIFIYTILNIILYVYTNGRLSFILINITMLVLLILKIKYIKQLLKRIIENKVIKVFIIALPVIMIVASISISRIYTENNQSLVNLNKILNNRIVLANNAYRKYDIRPFGQAIEWRGWGGYGYEKPKEANYEYNFVDNSYVRLDLDHGYIYAITIILLYMATLAYFYKKKEWYALYAIIMVLMWSYIEPYIAIITRNILSAALAYPLIRNMDKINQKKHNKLLNKDKEEQENEV